MKHIRLALAAAGLVTALPSLAVEWNAPQEPFALFGNSYYVGPRGVASVLITSNQGHILIDGGSDQSPPQIAERIRQLGFKPEDIRFILVSHAHIDHAGGIAALQRLSNAEVLAAAAGVPVLRSGVAGRDDPQYGTLPKMAPIDRVRALKDGETVKLGPLAVTMHATPGHTQGGASWSWQSSEGGRTASMVYADSLNSYGAGSFRFSGDARYPAARRDVERSIATIAALPCDVLVSAHPEVSDLWTRYERRTKLGNAAFIDAGACKAYAANAGARLQQRLAEEAARP